MEDFNQKSEGVGFGHSAPGGFYAEREFVADVHKETKSNQEVNLRKKITKIDEDIAHTEASIDVLVARIVKGRTIKGAEDLKMKLEEEAGLAKNELLQEVAHLKAEKNTLEQELGDL